MIPKRRQGVMDRTARCASAPQAMGSPDHPAGGSPGPEEEAMAEADPGILMAVIALIGALLAVWAAN